MNSSIIATIQDVPINLIEGPAGEEVVEFVADADQDNDGIGGNPEHDPYHQNDTTLHDPSGKALNAYQVSFIVVPPVVCQQTKGKVLGSMARLENLQTGKITDAVVGDIGPKRKIGELSPAAAKQLGLRITAFSGESRKIVRYTIFVGKPATINGVTYGLKSYGG